MAFSLLHLQAIGYVGQDPEVKKLDNGEVINFSLAVTERWKDRRGDSQEHTEWLRIQSYNVNHVETIEKYVKKGSSLSVQCKPRTRKYTDRDGVERTIVEYTLMGFQLLGDADGGGRDDDRGRGRDDDRGRGRDDDRGRGRDDDRRPAARDDRGRGRDDDRRPAARDDRRGRDDDRRPAARDDDRRPAARDDDRRPAARDDDRRPTARDDDRRAPARDDRASTGGGRQYDPALEDEIPF